MLLSTANRTAQKIEAKYNVVSEYQDFHLHSAASKGNLALVHYALNAGQPVNSVLEGLLALHVAASSGSEPVVIRLLEAGADVNAPRLPLRYNHDKLKNGGVIVGTAGCTPLHFAAANGHANIVRLLLAHGADPTKGDKNGVLPQDVASEAGHPSIADLLVQSSLNHPSSSTPAQSIVPPSPSRSRILRLQRSIDNALSLSSRRPSLATTVEATNVANNVATNVADSGDALNQINDQPHPSRRPSLPTLIEKAHKHRPPRLQRPSSAGDGADRRKVKLSEPPSPNFGDNSTFNDDTIGPTRKPASKYSLVNIFKKSVESVVSEASRPQESASAVCINRTLEQMFDAPVLPPKISSAVNTWYRGRKSSEVAVSSPLALASTVLPDADTDTKPPSPASDHGHLQSSSVSDNEQNTIRKAPDQGHEHVAPHILPSTFTSLSYTVSPPTAVEEGTDRASDSRSYPPLIHFTEAVGSTQHNDDLSNNPIPDPFPPPEDTTLRVRGNSLSSNSETSISSNNGSASTTTVSTNTSLTNTSPTAEKFAKSTEAQFVMAPPVPTPLSDTTFDVPTTPTTPDSARSRTSNGYTDTRERRRSRLKVAPIVLQGVSSRAEAEILVQRTREEILSKTARDFDPSSVDSAGPSLAEQLEAYGRSLQLERHFTRGEAQKSPTRLRPKHKRLSSHDEEDVADLSGPEPVDEASTRTNGSESSSSNVTASPLASRIAGGTSRSKVRVVETRSHQSRIQPPYTSALEHESQYPLTTSLPRSSMSTPAIRSPSQSAPPVAYGSKTSPKRRRPTDNMPSLHHMQSLEAKLNRQYHDSTDEDVDEQGFRVQNEPHRTPARRGSNIEIVHTLPTPTESPASSIASALYQHHQSGLVDEAESPIYQSPLANANTKAAPGMASYPRERARNIPEYIGPSENAFPPRAQLLKQKSSTTNLPRVREDPMASSAALLASQSAPVNLASYDTPSSPTGKRSRLRNFVQTLKGR